MTLVPVVVLGVVLAAALNHVIKNRALQEAENRAGAVTRLAAARAGVGDTSRLSRAEAKAFRRTLGAIVKEGDALAATVWDQDGKSLYSVG
ncbi:MAG TPA: hypothetical protein VEX36_03135, partial [Thermoleophilaceae bacterium]|nr:hypothetical protein [Thermoleophilaceae bacterium]